MACEGAKLYHYTSKEGYNGMRSSGKIQCSTDTIMDAALGRGVYMTHLPPSENSAKIISNNWDAGLDIDESFINNYLEKLDICLEFDSNDLPGLEELDGSRDVVKYPQEIDLNAIPHKVHRKGEGQGDSEIFNNIRKRQVIVMLPEIAGKNTFITLLVGGLTKPLELAVEVAKAGKGTFPKNVQTVASVQIPENVLKLASDLIPATVQTVASDQIPETVQNAIALGIDQVSKAIGNIDLKQLPLQFYKVVEADEN